MKYLSLSQIALIHSMIVDETSGMHGIRDRHLLSSIELSPQQSVFGKELYPTIFLKAAIYTHNIIKYHPFLDGNKRTAMTAAVVFLENNNYLFGVDKGKVEKFALKIINEKLSIEKIASWFEKHSKKIN